jgi:hypothetical protein
VKDPTTSAVAPADAAGATRRVQSPETRARKSAAQRARWDALPPAERERLTGNLRRGVNPPRAAAPTPPPPADPADPAATAAPEGGRRSPLDDAGRTGSGGPRVAPPRPLGRLTPPPLFVVPDFPASPELESAPGIAGEPDDLDAPPPLAVTPEQVGALLAFPFDLAALRRGPHWRLRPDERAMLAEPLARKVNEHAALARLVGAGGDWAVIAGGLAIILVARLSEDAARDRIAPDAARTGGLPAHDDDRPAGGPPADDAGGPRVPRLNGFALDVRANDARRPAAVAAEGRADDDRTAFDG